MVGRKPKPAALHDLEGTRNRHKNKGKEPHFSGVPECPVHLNPIARDEWDRISESLIDQGLLTTVDSSALAAYCAAYSRWVDAEDHIFAQGSVINSPKSGFPIPNPYVGIANTSLGLMHKFLTEFGMTPASRSRISVSDSEGQQDKDPLALFLSGINTSDESDNIQ